MAPTIIDSVPTPVVPVTKDTASATKYLQKKPLKLSGSLDSFESFDVTPIIGREFPAANLKEWLHSPNSDALLRDLAITISQRGVVFFRKQDELDDDLQKELIQRLGLLAGKPSASGLHVHPVHNSSREHASKDDEISVITSKDHGKLYQSRLVDKKQSSRNGWHSDITFEPVPSDYTALRLTQLPKTGGDTLWASGYEVYDRISKPYQQFLDGLTATYAQPGFSRVARENDFEIFTGPRGAPENVGEELKAVHPVIRTNPVTGWKSVFAVGHHVAQINDLCEDESNHLLRWFVTLIVENHDLQARLRWQNPNDLAIWDNRSVYHAATFDYNGLGTRTGHRVVGLGEKPYFDPKSTSRREALEHQEGENRT